MFNLAGSFVVYHKYIITIAPLSTLVCAPQPAAVLHRLATQTTVSVKSEPTDSPIFLPWWKLYLFTQENHISFNLGESTATDRAVWSPSVARILRLNSDEEARRRRRDAGGAEDDIAILPETEHEILVRPPGSGSPAAAHPAAQEKWRESGQELREGESHWTLALQFHSLTVSQTYSCPNLQQPNLTAAQPYNLTALQQPKLTVSQQMTGIKMGRHTVVQLYNCWY